MGVSAGVSQVYVDEVLAPYALNNLEDAPTMYIGKVSKEGAWLVQKFVQATGAMTYANVSNNASVADYANAWTNRATLSFGQFQTLTGV
jgi:heptaprenylglyceryl phosphate synthase